MQLTGFYKDLRNDANTSGDPTFFHPKVTRFPDSRSHLNNPDLSYQVMKINQEDKLLDTARSNKALYKMNDDLRVGIIGAGLGGLAAAIGIRRAGHQVTILEQAKELGEVLKPQHKNSSQLRNH